MEEIIKALSEIDRKSAKIIEAANNEKQALELDYKKRKDDYKKQAEECTTHQVQALRDQLNLEMQDELTKQSDAAKKYLEELDYNYEHNHEKIALELFNSLIKQ